MSQMCNSIDTLSMSYLDEELAPEEKRELELHLHECASCRDRVQEERQEASRLRQLLAAPPAPDPLRAKVHRLLDREDAQATRAQLRERLARWLLPGTAMAVAAAAMAVFVFLREPAFESSLPAVGRVAQMPMSVTGVRTGPWVEEQMDATAPSFGVGIELVGGRMARVEDRNVAQLVYEVSTAGRQRFQLEAFLFRARAGELRAGKLVPTSSGRELYVSRLDGLPVITYVDENQVGYVFLSQDLSERALRELVFSSDLIDRARGGR
jgi:anti-sigma factor RsiW